jgi:hypothetical protein
MVGDVGAECYDNDMISQISCNIATEFTHYYPELVPTDSVFTFSGEL